MTAVGQLLPFIILRADRLKPAKNGRVSSRAANLVDPEIAYLDSYGAWVYTYVALCASKKQQGVSTMSSFQTVKAGKCRTFVTTVLFSVGFALATAPAAVAAEYQSFSVTLLGQLSFIGPFETGSLDRCNANFFGDGEFPGHFVSVFDSAHGNGTFLGEYTFEGSFCAGLESPLSPQGEGTFIAADGDELHVVFENFSPISNRSSVRVSGIQSIIGGTGRFAGASGNQACQFKVNVVLGTVKGNCTGVIAFAD